MKYICSACILGIKCRYDGGSNKIEKILCKFSDDLLVPACPEQLGGLPTPREPCEPTKDGKKIIQGEGKVSTKSGQDITNLIIKGGNQVLKIARLLDINKAIMKQGSPSCVYGKIPDGNFSGNRIKGIGIASAILEENGIKIYTEKDI